MTQPDKELLVNMLIRENPESTIRSYLIEVRRITLIQIIDNLREVEKEYELDET